MKQSIAILVGTLVGSGCASAKLAPAGAVTIEVYTKLDPTVTLSGSVLTAAEFQASYLLREAGIRLEWRRGQPARWEPGSIGLTFVPQAPETFRCPEKRSALASARPFGSGTAITVYTDRVQAYIEPYPDRQAAMILGHIFAHEIVHVLEGEARHSETGLMKASWSHADLWTMTRDHLRLAAEDLDILQSRFAFIPAAAPTSSVLPLATAFR